MITPLLERAILKGIAVYKRYTCAMGGFFELKVPDGKTMIITDLRWNNFNQALDNVGANDVQSFQRICEYQLKIESKISLNTMMFRNILIPVLINNAPFTLGSQLQNGTVVSGTWWYPAPPISQDVYFLCEQFIKLTVTHNAWYGLVSTTGTPAPAAGESNAPVGVNNLNVLKRLKMTTNTAHDQYYTPPTNEGAGLTNPAGGRNMENYNIGTDSSCVIFPPDTGHNALVNTPALTQPLIELGVVLVNSNYFTGLRSQ